VAAVARPEFQIVNRGRCRNQRVTQLYVMAFREALEVFAGTAANRNIYRDTLDNGKKPRKGCMFQRSCAMPEFRDSHG